MLRIQYQNKSQGANSLAFVLVENTILPISYGTQPVPPCNVLLAIICGFASLTPNHTASSVANDDFCNEHSAPYKSVNVISVNPLLVMLFSMQYLLCISVFNLHFQHFLRSLEFPYPNFIYLSFLLVIGFGISQTTCVLPAHLIMGKHHDSTATHTLYQI
jgi:hypothetical protein